MLGSKQEGGEKKKKLKEEAAAACTRRKLETVFLPVVSTRTWEKDWKQKYEGTSRPMQDPNRIRRHWKVAAERG